MNALGLAARRLGRLDEAEAAVRAGLQAAPGNAVLWLNLGNVAFARQDVAGAIANYTKAAELDPRLFAPHYNLGVAYREGFKFAESEAETRRAGELDPEAAAFYAGLDASRLKGVHRGRPLRRRRSSGALARASGEEQSAATDHLWESLMLGAPIDAWPAVVGALLLLGAALGAWRLQARAGHRVRAAAAGSSARAASPAGAASCVRSATTSSSRRRASTPGCACRRWGRSSPGRGCCACGTSSARRSPPAAGTSPRGRFRPGVLLLFPASFFEARLLLGHGGFPSPWSLGSAASAWFVGAGVACFAALWLLEPLAAPSA